MNYMACVFPLIFILYIRKYNAVHMRIFQIKYVWMCLDYICVLKHTFNLCVVLCKHIKCDLNESRIWIYKNMNLEFNSMKKMTFQKDRFWFW